MQSAWHRVTAGNVAMRSQLLSGTLIFMPSPRQQCRVLCDRTRRPSAKRLEMDRDLGTLNAKTEELKVRLA